MDRFPAQVVAIPTPCAALPVVPATLGFGVAVPIPPQRDLDPRKAHLGRRSSAPWDYHLRVATHMACPCRPVRLCWKHPSHDPSLVGVCRGFRR